MPIQGEGRMVGHLATGILVLTLMHFAQSIFVRSSYRCF